MFALACSVVNACSKINFALHILSEEAIDIAWTVTRTHKAAMQDVKVLPVGKSLLADLGLEGEACTPDSSQGDSARKLMHMMRKLRVQ